MNDLKKVENVQLPTEIKSELKKELCIDLDQSKSFTEKAKDYATVVATNEAFKDIKLIDQLANLKKSELNEAAKADLKLGQAQNNDAEKTLQKSIFGVYEGLASYVGIKKELPKMMLNVLMFFMQPILGILFLLIGLITGTINIVLDGAESVVTKFKDLTDKTRKLVWSLLLIGLCIMIVLLVKYYLEKYGIFLF